MTGFSRTNCSANKVSRKPRQLLNAKVNLILSRNVAIIESEDLAGVSITQPAKHHRAPFKKTYIYHWNFITSILNKEVKFCMYICLPVCLSVLAITPKEMHESDSFCVIGPDRKK